MKKILFILIVIPAYFFDSNWAIAGPKKQNIEKLSTLNLSHYQDNFDYHGIKLGITLSDFKNIPPVMYKYQQNGLMDIAGYPLCSDDAESKKMTYFPTEEPENSDAGIVTCIWAYHNDSKFSSNMPLLGIANVGDYGSDRYGFEFLKMPDDLEPHLFHIHLSMTYAALPNVIEGLTTKFGEQTSITNEIVHNSFNAEYNDFVVGWENKSSKIIVESRYSDIDTGRIDYELKNYVSYANIIHAQSKRKNSM